ncbi:hypothetical protein V6N13_025669 [Hibiscus sabdariffa]|uniref:Uncharacterized protein n=1 Tax=Hibiscus sabdariffa TaxID=183260 RepID=A0ABR2C9R3_9ROSI
MGLSVVVVQDENQIGMEIGDVQNSHAELQQHVQVVADTHDVVSDGGVVGDVDVMAPGGSQDHFGGVMSILGSGAARVGDPNEGGLVLDPNSNVGG